MLTWKHPAARGSSGRPIVCQAKPAHLLFAAAEQARTNCKLPELIWWRFPEGGGPHADYTASPPAIVVVDGEDEATIRAGHPKPWANEGSLRPAV